MNEHEEWMRGTYERIVEQSGSEGVSVSDARKLAAEEYAVAIESGELELPAVDTTELGGQVFDRTVAPLRSQRKKSMQRDMSHLLDALQDNTILGPDDPALAVAYPLGDGRDKVLALWNAEDWRNASIGRYRNAADVMAVAQIFDEQSALIIAALEQQGPASTTRDLFVTYPAA